MSALERPMVNVYELDADGVEHLVYRQMNDTEYADWQAQQKALTTAQKEAAAAAWVELRLIRDRWLAQTDYVELFLSSPNSFTPLPTAIQNAISSNSAGWTAWRQALRDLPSVAGLDPVAAVATAGGIHATSDTFPAPWPQPPAAPTIHLS